MNLCAASDKYLTLCGQDNVYIVSLHSDQVVTLSLVDSRPPIDPKLKQEKVSGVCINISNDSKYICASDSLKNVYLYENLDSLGWKLMTCFQVDKRLMKVDFDCQSNNLIMVDKCGDLWAREISTVTEIKKILGHCSVILDAKLNRDNTEIFTSDRDEKIRVSRFPQGFVIKDYLLGHVEAVVSLHLTADEKYLVSVDIDGHVKFWDLDNHQCVKSFNMLKFLNFEDLERRNKEMGKSVDYQVLAMKAIELSNNIYLCIKISHHDKIPFFKFNVSSMDVLDVGQVENVDFKYWDMCWVDNSLHVIAPGSLKDSKKITISEDDKLSTTTCQFLQSISNLEEIDQDLKEFSAFSDSSVPLRKRGYDTTTSSSERPNKKVSRIDVEME